MDDDKLSCLEEEQREDADPSEHTEGAEGRQDRGGSDPEGNEVRDGGDSDGDPSVTHGGGQSLWHRQRLGGGGQGVPALRDHEHVVYADAKQEEGHHGVSS